MKEINIINKIHTKKGLQIREYRYSTEQSRYKDVRGVHRRYNKNAKGKLCENTEKV